jgi:hypothetical protein
VLGKFGGREVFRILSANISKGEEARVKALTIFKDHVFFPETREELSPIEGLSLEKFSNLVLRWSKYSSYLLRTERIALNKSSDYDGSPFEDSYQLRFNVENSYTNSEDPYLLVAFESVFDGDYDYTAMASRSTTTAYKRGRPVAPTETKFKINRVFLRRKAGGTDEWFKCEVARLNKALDNLDQAMTDLSVWAASDISMRVLCSTTACPSRKNPTIISPSQLATHANAGMSVDEFRGKLKCKSCGARSAVIGAA